MTKRTLLRAAVRDLDQILDYLQHEAGSANAAKYGRLFDRQLDLMKRLPGAGAPRPELGVFTRIAVVSPYVIIYDYDTGLDEVFVLRVLHGRRNITQKLLSALRSDSDR